MAYEYFKKIKTKEEFFSGWKEHKLDGLTEDLKDYIYNKYAVKCKVLKRDEYTCQNEDCKYCKNVQYYGKLTFHHVKFKKNFKDKNGNFKGNPNKERNGVTLCNWSHNWYHKAKCKLVFQDNPTLPAHIRGHTFQLERPDRIDWKVLKKDMRILRQKIKFQLDESVKKVPVGQRKWFILTAEQILILMKWLTIPYDEMDD